MPPLLVSLDVHSEIGPGLDPSPHDAPDHELQAPEGFAAAPYEQAGVVALYVEDWATDVVPLDAPEVHDRRDAELIDKLPQHLAGGCHNVRRALQNRDTDASGLATDAQDTSLALANDVYFDLAALDVELL